MAPPYFPQPLAMLVAFWLNSMLHGMYIVLFLRWFFVRRQGSGSSTYYTLTCWAVFILSNIDTGINFSLLILGYWESLKTVGPIVFFDDISTWPTVWREVNYQLILTLSDAFMIYRLWLIWERNYYIVILPTMLVFAESVFGFLAPAREALGQVDLLQTTVNILLGFNTSLQVVITLLITFRLLSPQVMNTLPAAQQTRRYQIVKCVIESGMMITVALVMDLALFAQHINFHWVFNIALAQLYSINTVLIVLRLNSILNASAGLSSSSHGQRSFNTAYVPPRTVSVISPHVPWSGPHVDIDPLDGTHSKMSPEDFEAQHSRSDDIELSIYRNGGRMSPPGALKVHMVKDVYTA